MSATPDSSGVGPQVIRDAARAYRTRGWVSVPVEFRGKSAAVGGDGWNRVTHDTWNLDRQFPKATPRNIGILWGRPSATASGAPVDVDLDTPEALTAADHLLPGTGSEYGRPSARRSHRLYLLVDPPDGATKYTDSDGTSLVELRSTGVQSVLPPSVHESGEPIGWDTDGDLAKVPAAGLQAAVARVAAAAILARHWPRKGTRDEAANALTGGLVRAGWSEEQTEAFVAAVTAAAGDDELRKRVAGKFGRTKAKIDDGQPVTGWPKLAELLVGDGSEIVGRVREWLGITIKITWGAGRRPSEASDVRTGRTRYTPLPPYTPFPTDALPEPWAGFVREGATALGCDEALVALPTVAVLAAAVGNTRRVYLGGEWFEPCVFWTCVIAESGSLKSPAADLSADLVKGRQKQLSAAYKEAAAEHKRATAGRKKAAEDPAPDPPVLGRVVVSDITIEKLAAVIDDNRRGVLLYRDELAGWLNSFTRYKGTGGGSDESNWLSIHRAGAIMYDRKTGDRLHVFVPDAAVSITGGIQPGVLARLVGQNLFDSGLVARVVVAYPPRTPKRYTDRRISDVTRAAAETSLDRLYALEGEEEAAGDRRPVVLKLTPEAMRRWKEHVNEWGLLQFEADGDKAAALAKLEGMAARFALLRACVHGTGTVGLPDIEAGITFAKWAAAEADRVYCLFGEDRAERDLRSLVDRVRRLADRQDGRVTVKVLQNSNSRKYPTRDAADADLNLLVVAGLGRWGEVPPTETGGWPVRYFTFDTPSADSPAEPLPTSDASDARPGEDDTNGGDAEPGGSDARPDPPTDDDDEHPTEYDANPAGDGGSSRAGNSQASRESEASEVGSSSSPETHPFGDDVGGGVAAESRVGTAAASVGAGGSELIAGPDELSRVVAVIEDWGGAVGLDTETTGLDPRTDRVRLIQLAVGADVFLIDVFALPEPRADLAELFEVLSRVEVVGHNLAFDLRFLARLGFTPARVCDTILLSRLADGTRAGHKLAEVVQRHLDRVLDKHEQKSDWAGELTPAQLRYAAADAAILIPLAEKLRALPAITRQAGTAALEMRTVPAVAWLQPVTVDAAGWAAIADRAAAEKRQLAGELDALAPDPNGLPGMAARNWNSPPQVTAAFAAVGAKLDSTDDDALAGVAQPAKAVELARLLRDYRGATKKAGTYGQTWLRKHVVSGGILPSWNQLGADTGRMSCSDPNLQQIPRGTDYRTCVIARPGCVLVKADYSQVEVRIAAKVADDAGMIEAYRTGADLHIRTAAAVLGKPEAEVAKADRQLAKAINFGLLYGMGAKSLVQYAKSNYGVVLTLAEAGTYKAKFFTAYPGLARWHETTRRQLERLADTAMFGTTTLGGRRRFIPSHKRKPAPGGGYQYYPNVTEALNSPVQGTGADGLKHAMALLWERRAECPGAAPVLVCHDEIVIETPAEFADRAADWLTACMVDGMAPLVAPVPVAVAVSTGPTWAG